MSLTSTIYAAISGHLAGSPDLGSAKYDLVMNNALVNLANGVGANQADKIFSDTRTIAASGTEDLDLAGVLVDPLGVTLTFAKIKAILIKAAAGNTNNVVVGNGTNPFIGPFGAGTHTLAVPPGGAILLAAPKNGWAVTGATADILKIANSGGTTSVTYDVVIVGTSA